MPQFLRVQVANVLATSSDSAVPLLREETAALVTKAMNSWARRSSHGLPAPRRLRLIEGSSARSREA